jgi:hypothetical protein
MDERSRWAFARNEDGGDYDALRRRLCGDANALAMQAITIRDRVDAITAAHAVPVQTTLLDSPVTLTTDRSTT